MSAFVALASLGLVLGGCRTGVNYVSQDGPGYSAGPSPRIACPERPVGTLRVVSFNVEFALAIEEATQLLVEDRDLRCADVVLLQEMDEPGTRRIAEALGLGFTYYPAVHHRKYDRDFGNAVLSRFPALDQSKLILPHVSLLTRTQRTATAVTLRVGDGQVRVYSTHLGTPLEVGPGSRREQLQAVMDDAEAYDAVIIGGDMNSGSVGRSARAAGYQWATEEGPSTVGWGRWDHIFARGFEAVGSHDTGTVLDSEAASDHRPVWAQLRIAGNP